MFSDATQFRHARRSIRKKRHKLEVHIKQSLPDNLFPPGIVRIIIDFCLPSRNIVNALESLTDRNNAAMVRVRDASSKLECTIGSIYNYWKMQSYGLQPVGYNTWECVASDLIDFYMGTPKDKYYLRFNNSCTFKNSALKCTDAVRSWIDGAMNHSKHPLDTSDSAFEKRFGLRLINV
jgi:hypothetical protein